MIKIFVFSKTIIVKFEFICIALFIMQIFAKLLYRKFEVSTLYLGVGFISGDNDINVQSNLCSRLQIACNQTDGQPY